MSRAPSFDRPVVERAVRPRSPGEWARLVALRRQLAARDPEHRFLWELDRQTHLDYFPFVSEIGNAEKESRTARWRELMPWLMHRMECRWARRTVSQEGPDAALRTFSAIVREVVLVLGDPVDTRAVGATLQRFAAGALAAPLDAGTRDEPCRCVVSEPDSFFVCFLTEFSLACPEQGIDAAFWRSLQQPLAMLPALFLERFAGRRPFTLFLDPPRALSDKEAAAVVRRQAARLKALRGDGGALLAETLQERATSFWG